MEMGQARRPRHLAEDSGREMGGRWCGFTDALTSLTWVPRPRLQAVKLLELMWLCGGELCPDIVSYNTVYKACGNAQQLDLGFAVSGQGCGGELQRGPLNGGRGGGEESGGEESREGGHFYGNGW